MRKKIKRAVRKVRIALNSRYIDEITANKKMSRSAALEKMNRAVREYGISKEEYVREGYYYLRDEDLDKLLNDPGISGRIDYVADRFLAPRGKVYARAVRAKEKYGISLYKFIIKDLYAVTSAKALKAVKEEAEEEKARKIQELADITGMNIPEMKKYIRDIRKKFGVNAEFIKQHELFKLSDEEIEEVVRADREENETRAEKIKKANGWDDFDLEKSRSFCRYRYRIHAIRVYDNMECWKYPREVLDTFAVPQDSIDMCHYYNTAPTQILDSKIRFVQTYKEFLGRKFWINRDTSIEEFTEFIDGLTDVFCKPTNLLGGHGSYRYALTGSIEEMYEYFMNEPMMLIEEIPKQHHLLSEIYDKSINSIRITTVLKDGRFVPFCTWIKFGGKGSVVDGRVGGGCFAGVDVNTGIVDTPAIDIDNNRFEYHQDTGKPITGFHIPFWKEALELTERALRYVDGIDFVGWDLCITENGPVIIEGNAWPAFGDIQLLYNYGNKDDPGQRWRYLDLMEDPDKWRRHILI